MGSGEEIWRMGEGWEERWVEGRADVKVWSCVEIW